MILAAFSGTCGARHLLCSRVGCCLQTRASAGLCAGGPGKGSAPAGRSAESRSRSACKAVGNAADEVSA